MSNHIPKISVVIPAFNEQQRIRDCITSLKNQSFQDFEIIVVDNDSTDDTAKIAKKFGANVVRETSPGTTAARQKGFSLARAPIIARTDADTIVAPDWLEIIYAYFDTHPDVIAFGGAFFTPQDSVLPSWFLPVSAGIYRIIHLVLTGHENLIGPNMAVRRSALRLVQPCMDDKLVHEDVELACHLSRIGRIAYVPSAKTSYSMRRFKRSFIGTSVEYTIRYLRTIFLHHPFWRCQS